MWTHHRREVVSDSRDIIQQCRYARPGAQSPMGQGTQTAVESEGVFMFRLLDVLTNSAGERIRAHIVLLSDPESGALRLQQGAVICLPT
jgi:hypothetical protein